ncbi:hypothetical protein GQ43DRAFT_433597 [Delitschia confertaspora ATCC 74209]|uniref:Uncharacterized protein n=1 Tax=Delitschia confertaspora ATCC 74209 TaxID=1513339 RepID=A0A9P4JL82_9PLEO|nr:hypothetical protein GQ43DRAFT_433597 [Delitschia confertaspora ATCC 74209]
MRYKSYHYFSARNIATWRTLEIGCGNREIANFPKFKETSLQLSLKEGDLSEEVHPSGEEDLSEEGLSEEADPSGNTVSSADGASEDLSSSKIVPPIFTDRATITDPKKSTIQPLPTTPTPHSVALNPSEKALLKPSKSPEKPKRGSVDDPFEISDSEDNFSCQTSNRQRPRI